MLALLTYPLLILDDVRSIAFQPYDQSSRKALLQIRSAVQKKFGFQPAVLPIRTLPKSAWYPARQRWRAEKLLLDLNQVRGYDKVLGLTSQDISTHGHGVKDWGVFGLGQEPGKACVLSTFRLGRRLAHTSKEERLKRLAFHEIGHTLGLKHCPVHPCIMNDSEGSIKSLDEASDFCASCKRKLGM